MNRGFIICFVTIIIAGTVTPLTYGSDRIYDGTIVGIDPENENPIEITYRYSRRRNMTVAAKTCEELALDDLYVGMNVKWTSLGGSVVFVVGSIPENPSVEAPP